MRKLTKKANLSECCRRNTLVGVFDANDLQRNCTAQFVVIRLIDFAICALAKLFLDVETTLLLSCQAAVRSPFHPSVLSITF